MPKGQWTKDSTTVKKKPATKKSVGKKADLKEIVVVNEAPYVTDNVPEVPAEIVDPNNVMVTKMLEIMQATIEQNKILIGKLSKNETTSVSEEAKVNNIYTPLKSKLFYRIQYFDYDAEGNKIIRNPMYEYKDFETMEELLAYADEQNLWPMNGRWGYIPNRVPMPDEYWEMLEKNTD